MTPLLMSLAIGLGTQGDLCRKAWAPAAYPQLTWVPSVAQSRSGVRLSLLFVVIKLDTVSVPRSPTLLWKKHMKYGDIIVDAPDS